VHAYSPAYKQKDIDTLLPLVDHLSFNSLHQWYTYKDQIVQSAVSPGLRVNPEHSETTTPIYDPAAPGSRLGVLAADLQEAVLSGLSGLHIHTNAMLMLQNALYKR
jgi:carboxynorspermidine decarboxylase